MRKANMKWMAMVIVSGLMALAMGCGSTQETSDNTSTSEAQAPAPKINPKEGMTKEEIATMYQGQPDSKRHRSDGGEVWKYHMNAGEAFIPYNYGYTPEFDLITFGPDGKVTSYELSHEPEKDESEEGEPGEEKSVGDGQ